MGLRPRDPDHPPRLTGPAGTRFWPAAGLAVLAAGAIALFATWEEFVGREEGLSTLGSFEPDFVDQLGEAWMWVAGAVAATVGLGLFLLLAVVRARRHRSAGATPATTDDDQASF